MQVVFRVDASHIIGSGHVMRCITLAIKLRQRSPVQCLFICRDHEGNMASYIEAQGFNVALLENNPNVKNNPLYLSWLASTQAEDAMQTLATLKKHNIKKMTLLVVDHYSLDSVWESQFQGCSKQLLVIDDLADRQHQCDMLLDQNIVPSYLTRYQPLLPKHCKTFLGLNYALLREDFYHYKKKVKVRTELQRLFVFFGGVDKDNMTLTCLKAISSQLPLLDIVRVIVGSANPHKREIEDFCKDYENCFYAEQVSNMAELMLNSDLAMGAGGTTTAERIFLGLPCLVYAIADNQYLISKSLGALGWIDFMGKMQRFEAHKLQDILSAYLSAPSLIERKSTQLLSATQDHVEHFIAQILKADNSRKHLI